MFAGSNSVNYAAISIALSLKCKVFVIAETNEQLENIKTNYPGVSKINTVHNPIVLRVMLYVNLIKVSPVSTTRCDSKFVQTVSKLTQNHGIDFVVLSKNVSNRLPELLADEAKIVVTENTDISVLSRKI